MYIKSLAFLLMFFMFACGNDFSTPAATGNGSGTAAPTASPSQLPAGGYLQGYVVSAFNLTVNGQSYADSEAFYTAEMASLTSQVNSAGYGGYSLQFDAQVGLSDLTYGMDVYVEAVGSSGFAGNTTVNSQGQFMLAIPDCCGTETFQIRTNKRVSALLTSPDKKTTVQWCYNFASTDVQGTMANPVIISTFDTSLTDYACDSNESSLQIPQNPAQATTASVATAPASGTTTAVAASNASGTTSAVAQ